jgi:hypothetical protein
MARVAGIGTHFFPERDGQGQPATLCGPKEKGNQRGAEAFTGGGTESDCFSFFEAKLGPETAQNGCHTICTTGQPMWGMEIHCGKGIWDATMEFPFQGQGSILPIGLGGLKWNFHSGGKNPFDTSGSILQSGISILGRDFLLDKQKQGPQSGNGFTDDSCQESGKLVSKASSEHLRRRQLMQRHLGRECGSNWLGRILRVAVCPSIALPVLWLVTAGNRRRAPMRMMMMMGYEPMQMRMTSRRTRVS